MQEEPFSIVTLPKGTTFYRGKVMSSGKKLDNLLSSDRSVYGFPDASLSYKMYVCDELKDRLQRGEDVQGVIIQYTLTKPARLFDVRKFNKVDILYPEIRHWTGKSWDDSDPTFFDMFNVQGMLAQEKNIPNYEIFITHPFGITEKSYLLVNCDERDNLENFSSDEEKSDNVDVWTY